MTAPAKIMRSAGVGFADYTVERRFPEIVGRAIVGLAGKHSVEHALERLLRDVMSGTRIDTGIFAMPTPRWREYVGALDGTSWSTIPFFDLELLFYHGINSLAGFFDDGTDVFLYARKRALREATLDASGTAGDGPGPSRAGIAARVRGALLANEADQSQAVACPPRDGPARVIVDQGDDLVARLWRCTDHLASLHMILDNAGPELLGDLALVAEVLAIGDATVVLHCKPWPMFVSDALCSDVKASIHHMISEAPASIRDRGHRLAQALATGRLELRAEPAWGEPRCFDDLGDDLSAQLAAATVVIAKGDLSYRRFVGDREWPADTPVAQAVAGVPFGGFALRVLKSEALVGIPRVTIDVTSREDRDWRTSGRYAVVQWLGR